MCTLMAHQILGLRDSWTCLGIPQVTRHCSTVSTQNQETLPINWTLDKENVEQLSFKGYEAGTKPSAVTGQPRLFYNRDKPYTKDIAFRNTYVNMTQVSVPKSYIIPQAYTDIITRLEANGVEMTRLEADETFTVQMDKIVDYSTVKSPYENHYLHSAVQVESKTRQWNYYEGDYIISTDQEARMYLVNTLEPSGPDSFFAWNFFDGILMQKEHYSDYVFEDTAARLLKTQPELKAKFEQKKQDDEVFRDDARAQLDYLYQQSKHYEPTYRLYPIGRVMR